jgi:hypothetical protein
MFLAAALAAGLMLPGAAHAKLQGFSIQLGDPQDPLTLDYNPAGGLSAGAAPSNGQPAKELQNNGSYLATLTGDYAVIDDLPPVNEPVFWLESYEITLNGREIFGHPTQIVGPFSGEDVWQAFLHVFNQVSGLPPADLNVIIAVLEHHDSFQTNGVFDYVYNTLNQPVGTFAVGTTADLGQRIALNVGTNTLSFDFSLFAVPEPPTWLMLGAGLLVVGVMRSQTRRFRSARGEGGVR